MPEVKRLGPNRPTTLQRKAYHFVKEKIMNRQLKPGSCLTDVQIASELGMSRTPVREALRLLEYEGFLSSYARRGWRVYCLSLKDIQEIFDIKETLESTLARKAAACADDQQRGRLKKTLERMKKSAVANDYEAWRKADVELHDILLAMSGNGRATRIIGDLNDQWYRVRLGLMAMQGRLERSTREHEVVVERILAEDGNGAERYMRSHLHNLREELERLLLHIILPYVETGV
ncbi:MAG: GntR family transcriptional regulator [Syntrophobacteraceae bacterium]